MLPPFRRSPLQEHDPSHFLLSVLLLPFPPPQQPPIPRSSCPHLPPLAMLMVPFPLASPTRMFLLEFFSRTRKQARHVVRIDLWGGDLSPATTELVVAMPPPLRPTR